ncbi:M24 family metallopeptidase [Prosthecomicrobium pneumaticum]|uniref:Xaa-Pro aminopeptidase n=1 Tax=Prosthecomicrobium pneumaticum TaxID=81895 RepID=A0A7W9FQC9_9HYPH|nr:aminopeptidase P family N-terminal domain-containing protein [Prosthecomicrobium pneumaticum]MBB5754846.1 hypothetical protein [Prosthecomicrobium pneumaticum]
MPTLLKTVTVPDFGVPLARPTIPAATYETRCREAYRRAGADWLVVYADREHQANIAFLTGFEPRFEEALLLLGPGDRRIVVTGNENESFTAVAGLPGIETLLAQSMSLMGQDRTRKPRLVDVLAEAGIARGATIGLVGWKYLEPEEWGLAAPAFFVPQMIVAALAAAAGSAEALRDATPVLMHPTGGLRSVVDADEIALLEWGAARASAALWRVLRGLRPGESELEAAARVGYAGEPMSCHMMLASSDSSAPVVGLASPTHRVLTRGDGVSTAVGYWGGLSARAGLLVDEDEAFLAKARCYFEALATWYETADLGVEGGTLFAAVTEVLAREGLRSALSPGHLVGYDEWVNSPVRPGSTERLASGMPFQVDVIPVPMKDGQALNCEDPVTFADAALRSELAARHPEVAARIAARRRFMADEIGIALKESILPMSSMPLCLPPFWLATDRLLVRG